MSQILFRTKRLSEFSHRELVVSWRRVTEKFQTTRYFFNRSDNLKWISKQNFYLSFGNCYEEKNRKVQIKSSRFWKKSKIFKSDKQKSDQQVLFEWFDLNLESVIHSGFGYTFCQLCKLEREGITFDFRWVWHHLDSISYSKCEFTVLEQHMFVHLAQKTETIDEFLIWPLISN